ncbi:hypothetical protein, variant [Sphaeroforma arctica JP610]|nr:hypothetical protein, variant [Sphaeroforma arctica JP610]KNC81703.1 hypothetical protein, variant [Sphaeroforma arctica JP610]|eukprot:XP_014155605.1 hypothetical protein, variant [Sphaeroforma arctica JP610]
MHLVMHLHKILAHVPSYIIAFENKTVTSFKNIFDIQLWCQILTHNAIHLRGYAQMSIASLIIASKYTRVLVRGPPTYYLHTSRRHLQCMLFRQSELQAHHKRAVPYKRAQFINTQPRKKLAHEFDYLPTADEMDAQDVHALAEDMQRTLDISNNDDSLEGKVACTCGKGVSPVNTSGNNDLTDAKPKNVLRTPLKSDFSVIDKDANMPKYTLQAIGTMESCFKEKNGTPRQGWLAPMSRAKLTLQLQNNKSHSLEGLEDFSHIWLIFMFSLNKASKPKYKVQPPRLDGDRVGVFSTRSPHRPNSIGIT